MVHFNTFKRQENRLFSSLEQVIQNSPGIPRILKTGLIAALFVCCFSFQPIYGQCPCNISYDPFDPTPGEVDLPLNINGTSIINAAFIDDFLNSTCDPMLVELWEDAGATIPFVSPIYTCVNVGDVVVVWATVNDLNDPSCGNSTTKEFQVTIIDDLVPVIVVPFPDPVFDVDPGLCSKEIDIDTLFAIGFDNCDAVVTYDIDGGPSMVPVLIGDRYYINIPQLFPVGTTTITWEIDDGSNPPATATHVVTINDNEPPVPGSAFPASFTIPTNASCEGPLMLSPLPTASDNCGILLYQISLTPPGGGTTDYDIDPLTGDATLPPDLPLGVTSATILLRDDSGNEVSHSFTITVEDDDAPIWDGAAPLSVSASPADCDDYVGLDYSGFVSDNCGVVSRSFTVTDQDGNPPVVAPVLDFPTGTGSDASGTYWVGIYKIKFFAEDAAGNKDSITVMLTVQDLIDPVALCQSVTVSLDADGVATVAATDMDGGSTDNCPPLDSFAIRLGGGDPWVSTLFFDCTDIGTFTNVRFRVWDSNLNTDADNVCDITIVDDMPPVAECKDITVELSGGVTPDVFPAAKYSGMSPFFVDDGSHDNCTVQGDLRFRIRKGTSGLFTAPQGAPITFDCSEIGPNTVEIRVRDDEGNTNFCQAIVTVDDVTPPSPTCNGPMTFSLDPITGTFDLLDPDPMATTPYVAVGLPLAIPDPGTVSHTITVPTSTLVGDVNVSFEISHMWVGDLSVVLTSPKGTSVTLFDRPGVPATGLGCSQDNLDVAFDDEAASSAALFENTCTTSPPGPYAISGAFQPIDLLSVFDGENMEGDWVLTITDAFGADVGMLESWTLTLTNSYMTLLGAGSMDECGCVTWTTDINPFDCSDIDFDPSDPDFDPHPYILTVSDGSGNTSTCQSTILIEDVTPPVAKCKTATIQLDNAGVGVLSTSMVDDGSSDICGFTLSVLPNTFGCGDVGSGNSVTLTATDPSGNTHSCMTTVTVEDNVPPVASCSDLTIALQSNGEVEVFALQLSLTSFDVCSGFFLPSEMSVNGSPPAPSYNFDCSEIGVNQVSVTVSDSNGNSATCPTTITIKDTEIPTLSASCVPDLTLEWVTNMNLDPGDIDSWLETDPMAVGSRDALAEDNCDVMVFWEDTDTVYAVDCSMAGYVFKIYRKWTAMDPDSNMVMCEQIITIEDNGAPTFDAPDDIPLDCSMSAGVARHICGIWVNSVDVPIPSDLPSPPDEFTSTITINKVDLGGPPETMRMLTSIVVRDLEISHTNVGQLEILLTSPDGTIVQLMKDGLSCVPPNVDIDFDDDAISVVTCPIDGGIAYQPMGTLADFYGEEITGTWTLTVIDHADPDGGALTNWSLDICYLEQQKDLTETGDVVAFDDCDLDPDEWYYDYHAYKDFVDHAGEANEYDFHYNNSWIESHSALIADSPVQVIMNGMASTDVMYTYSGPSLPTGNSYIAFDWDFTSSDAANQDQFGYDLGGGFIPLAGISDMGRALIKLTSGSFKFVLRSDADGSLPSVNITNFVFTDGDFPQPLDDCPRKFCIARIWQSGDACGNLAAKQLQIITTDDVGGPSFGNAPSLVEVDTDPNVCLATVTQLDISSELSDDCGIVSITNDALFGDGMANANGDYPPGVYEITFMATDDCGKTTTKVITLIVTDNQIPEAICKHPELTLSGGSATLPVSSVNNGSFDNCEDGDLVFALSQSVFTSPGQYVVTMTVTDTTGNEDFCLSNVTVLGGLVFDVDDVSGTNGSMQMAQVTADNFEEVLALDLYLKIDDTGVATTTFPTQTGGVVPSTMLTDNGTFFFDIISDDTVRITWISTNPAGLTLPNGTSLFSVKTNLVGMAGDLTTLDIVGDEVFTVPGGLVTPIPTTALSGTITIVAVTPEYTVSGTLLREQDCLSPGGDPVNNVTVTLTGASSTPASPDTDADGSYSFSVLSGSSVVVRPFKDGTKNPPDFSVFPPTPPGTWFTGIDVSDVDAVTDHLFGTPLDSPYKIIAGDANKDNSISIIDVFIIQQLALFKYPAGLENTAWRFVDSSFVFDPMDPFTFPDSAVVNNISADERRGFISMKVGDVAECDADPDLFTGNGNSSDGADGTMPFIAANEYVTAGQDVAVSFAASEFVDLTAYQFTLHFDKGALQYLSFQPGELSGLAEDNLNLVAAEHGYIAANWFGMEPVELENGTTVFTFTFHVKEDGLLSELMEINSEFVLAKAIKGSGDIMGVNLEFDSPNAVGEESALRFALYQNKPNPFGHTTQIGFYLPKADHAKLSIFDPAGKVLKVIENRFAAGYHQVNIDRDELPASGVLIYQLETSTDRAVRKMVIID